MAIEQAHRNRIVNYYDAAQFLYGLVWHGSALGFHYGFWDSTTSGRHQAILKENEVLADLVGVKKDDLVLDAGCGIGGSGIWLAQERGARVVGINIVEKQLTKARRLAQARGLSQQLSFEEGDYQQLQFNSDTFDVYWSLESIEHATSVENVVSEAFRVLKPGGRMVVAATFKGRDDLSEEESRELKVGFSAAGCFNDFKTADEVAGIMNLSGFKDVKNINKTKDVMKSSEYMRWICRLGLPGARVAAYLGLIPEILVLNNEWGVYQEGLFRSGATSYNVLLATKPV